MTKQRGFWGRSLRGQLVVLGLAAVIVPLLLLVAVFAVSSSSDSIVSEAAPEGSELSATEVSEDPGGVPAAVIISALGLIAVGIGAVWVWSGRAVRPMEAITNVANDIQAGSLDRRIGNQGGTAEVQALSQSFDSMLDRLDSASSTQRQLVEDASHELRTPLAALAVNNEVIIEHPSPGIDDYRAAAERSKALIARLQVTIDDLLAGARARTQATQQVDNDLMLIVSRVVSQHRALNPAIPVVVYGPPELRLGIDGPSVQRALVNLMENAARYSPSGTPIEVSVTVHPVPSVSVTDHGPGIPASEQSQVFDRYYRSGPERDPSDGGSGIGLALVKQVADAHGEITIVSPVPGTDRGTRFTVTFAS